MIDNFNVGVYRGFKLNDYKLIKETVIEEPALEEEKPVEEEQAETDEKTDNTKGEHETIDMLTAHERLGRFILSCTEIVEEVKFGKSDRLTTFKDERLGDSIDIVGGTSNGSGTGRADGTGFSADGNKNNPYKVVNSVNDSIPDECDKVVNGVEIENYINEFRTQLADYLKSKYNYSDDFIDNILDFIINKALNENQLTDTITSEGKGIILEKKDKTYNIKTVLESMKNNTFELLSGVSWKALSRINDSLSAMNFGNKLEQIQYEWLSGILKNIYNDLNIEDLGDELSFNNMIKEKLGLKSYGDLSRLDKNGDGTWVDEFYEFVITELKNIKNIDKETVDNAKTMNLDLLFNGKQNLTAEDILNNINSYAWSDDPGVRKFAKLIKEKMLECSIKYVGNYSDDYFIKTVITLLNKKNGIKGNNADILKSGTLNSNNILSQLNEILNSKEFDNMMLIPIDGVIDDFSQGDANDCWLLSGLMAFSSSQYGKDYIKNAIKWNDDHTAISVKFNDRTIYLTVDEIMQFYKEEGHAKMGSDIDVIVIEAAFKKLLGDISGDNGNWLKFDWRNSGSFFEFFGNSSETRTETCSGVDDVLSLIGYAMGGNGKCDIDGKNVRKYLQDILNNMQSGNYSAFAATFALFSAGNATYTWRTIDGKYVSFDLNAGAHVFAITEITPTTVTFVNPHDSSESYTVTWDEFINIGIAEFSASYFK